MANVLDAIRDDLAVSVAVTMLDRELPIDEPLARLVSSPTIASGWSAARRFSTARSGRAPPRCSPTSPIDPASAACWSSSRNAANSWTGSSSWSVADGARRCTRSATRRRGSRWTRAITRRRSPPPKALPRPRSASSTARRSTDRTSPLRPGEPREHAADPHARRRVTSSGRSAPIVSTRSSSSAAPRGGWHALLRERLADRDPDPIEGIRRGDRPGPSGRVVPVEPSTSRPRSVYHQPRTALGLPRVAVEVGAARISSCWTATRRPSTGTRGSDGADDGDRRATRRPSLTSIPPRGISSVSEAGVRMG